MKTYQIVKENENHEIDVLETSTRKSDIRRAFNRWMRICEKMNHFVDRRNEGWAFVTVYTDLSQWTDEYYIRVIA